MDSGSWGNSNTVIWHRPERANGVGLVLTHGAGANCRTPLLQTVAEASCARGVTVVRYDLPFRQKRPSGPPHPSGGAEDRRGLLALAEEMRRQVGGAVVLAGHSYGGRQCSMLAAEEPGAADGLLLLSYPLHPPGKPEQLRTGHFPLIRVPALFVSGVRDEFGTPEELEREIHVIPGGARLQLVEGAGHDLRRGKFDTGLLVNFLLEFASNKSSAGR